MAPMQGRVPRMTKPAIGMPRRRGCCRSLCPARPGRRTNRCGNLPRLQPVVLRAPGLSRFRVNHTTYVAPISLPYIPWPARAGGTAKGARRSPEKPSARKRAGASLPACLAGASRAYGRASQECSTLTRRWRSDRRSKCSASRCRLRSEWSLLRLPLWAVIATDPRHSQGVGWAFAPHLHLKARRLVWLGEGSLGVGPLYASEAYHDYYDEVAPVCVPLRHAPAIRRPGRLQRQFRDAYAHAPFRRLLDRRTARYDGPRARLLPMFRWCRRRNPLWSAWAWPGCLRSRARRRTRPEAGDWNYADLAQDERRFSISWIRLSTRSTKS